MDPKDYKKSIEKKLEEMIDEGWVSSVAPKASFPNYREKDFRDLVEIAQQYLRRPHHPDLDDTRDVLIARLLIEVAELRKATWLREQERIAKALAADVVSAALGKAPSRPPLFSKGGCYTCGLPSPSHRRGCPEAK